MRSERMAVWAKEPKICLAVIFCISVYVVNLKRYSACTLMPLTPFADTTSFAIVSNKIPFDMP